MKQNIIRLILFVLIGLMTANTVNAGFTLHVTPDENIVSPGGTAKFTVDVAMISGVNAVEIVDLRVVDDSELDGLGNPNHTISWKTNFTPDLFPIGPYPDEKTSTLEIEVPNTFTTAVNFSVRGDGYYDDGTGLPWYDFGVAELFVYPISVAPVPELNTTILTSAGLLGLVFVSRKYKGT